MDNKAEKKLNLKDFFYVVKQKWIIEIAILIVCLLIGGILATLSPKYYVAKTTVWVDMRADETASSTTAPSLAKYYLNDIIAMFSDDKIINDATYKLPAEYGKCSSGSISAAAANEDSAFTIAVQYKDSSPDTASKKLVAVINSIKDYFEATKEVTDKNGNVVEIPANTANQMVINPVYPNKVTKVDAEGNVVVDETGATVYEEVPSVAVGSKKKTIFLLSIILGIAATFIYALCVYFIADKVSSVAKLESITQVKNFGILSKKKVHASSPDALLDLNLSRIADAIIYDHICTKRQVYQIQSTTKGEGKTSVVINLAKDLGDADRKTLIIDCDFANPSVHKKLALHRHVGITDYFKEVKTFDEIVKNSVFQNVDVITCGDRIENHTIFFASDKFKTLIAEAREKYDFILIDCAPVSAVSDYMSISGVTDAALMVVADSVVSAKDLGYAVNELQSSGANLIGTVFNFSDQVKTGYDYRYSYGDDEQ